MAEEAIVAPAEESKQTEPAIAEAVKEATVGEALSTEPVAVAKEESVPLATFLEMKKENKELQREMKSIRKSIEEGATKKEVSTDIKALAEKYGLDETNTDLFQDLTSAVRAQLEQEVEVKLKPLADKEKAEKIDKAFNTHFSKALETLPEYKGIADAAVIKTLSLQPHNASKTFPQLLEEVYGKFVTGKRTMESTSSRASKNDSNDIDFDQAKKDPAYYNEVMANPATKKKYNEAMMNRFKNIL